MTIPDQLRALASFVEEHELTDDDIYSAEINYDGGRLHLRLAPFRALAACLCETMNVSSEGNTHHAAKTAAGGMTVMLAAVTRPDEVAP